MTFIAKLFTHYTSSDQICDILSPILDENTPMLGRSLYQEFCSALRLIESGRFCDSMINSQLFRQYTGLDYQKNIANNSSIFFLKRLKRYAQYNHHLLSNSNYIDHEQPSSANINDINYFDTKEWRIIDKTFNKDKFYDIEKRTTERIQELRNNLFLSYTDLSEADRQYSKFLEVSRCGTPGFETYFDDTISEVGGKQLNILSKRALTDHISQKNCLDSTEYTGELTNTSRNHVSESEVTENCVLKDLDQKLNRSQKKVVTFLNATDPEQTIKLHQATYFWRPYRNNIKIATEKLCSIDQNIKLTSDKNSYNDVASATFNVLEDKVLYIPKLHTSLEMNSEQNRYSYYSKFEERNKNVSRQLCIDETVQLWNSVRQQEENF